VDGGDAHLPRREPPGVSRRALLRLGFTPRARPDVDFDGVTERVRAGCARWSPWRPPRPTSPT
jgi:hypothetical protein